MRPILAVIKAMLVATFVAGAQAQPTLSPWTRVGEPNAVNAVMGGANPAILIARRQDADPVRTTDGGATWTPFTVLGVRPELFVASPNDPMLFYALSGPVLAHRSGPNPPPPTLYRSSNAGSTWQLVRERLEAGGGWLGSVRLGAQPGLMYATRMEPSMCDVNCFFEGAEAFRSRDGGTSWQPIDAGLRTGLESYDVRALHPSQSDLNVVYAVTRYGIFRSGDQGESWELLRPVDPFEPVRQLVVDARDAQTVYVRPDDHTQFWVTQDGGATWRTTAPIHVPGPNRHLIADPVDAGRIYLLGFRGDILESRDRAGSWNRVAPSDAAVGIWSMNEFSDEFPPPVGVSNNLRHFIVPGEAGLRRMQLRDDALAFGSDLWWNPAQSGAGWSITQHASGQMFVVWYGYDTLGAPTWRAMPGGTWSDGGRTFTGSLYTATGPDFFGQPFNPAAVSVRPLGSATLRFDDSDNATFSYSLADAAGETRITRMLFGPQEVVRWRPENYADLWWNASESGWGLAFSQQYSTAFATWYVYDAAGNPLWVVMPEGRLGWEEIGWNFFGDIYTTHGPRFGQPFDPAQVVVTPIGKASIAFDGFDRAILTYNLSGQNETRHLTRQPF